MPGALPGAGLLSVRATTEIDDKGTVRLEAAGDRVSSIRAKPEKGERAKTTRQTVSWRRRFLAWDDPDQGGFARFCLQFMSTKREEVGMLKQTPRERFLLASAAATILCLFLAGCETQDTYPISGEECSPEDPVHTLDSSGCVV